MLKEFGIAPFALIVLFLLVGTVSAQPGLPLYFYGDVTINGVKAPDGVLVEARVSGSYVSGTTTSGGTYGEASPFYVPDPHGTMSGKTIEFYVHNVKAAEYVFNVNDNPVNLDLSVSIPNFCGDGKCESGESCSSCSKDCGSCNPPGGETSGGGGGGSSGGSSGSSSGGAGITPSQPPKEEGPCVEDWICTDWTECVNGKQTRTCADVNRCGTSENKPVEKQDCLVPAVCNAGETKCEGNKLMACSETEDSWTVLEECEFGCSEGGCIKGGIGGLPTGMFIMLPAAVALIVLIVIVMIGLYFVRIRK